MTTQLTVSEAIAEGFTHYGYDTTDYQHIHDIEGINPVDFEGHKLLLFSKEPTYTPSISPEDLAEVLADYIEDQTASETRDDTMEVFNIVKGLDFTEAANKINGALDNHHYYTLTDIELIPDPAAN